VAGAVDDGCPPRSPLRHPGTAYGHAPLPEGALPPGSPAGRGDGMSLGSFARTGPDWLELLGERRSWDSAELLHQLECVEDAPVLVGEAVVAEADDVDQLDVDGLA